ncbi:hypothetical protein H6P81_002293 [Aristolochia fimbriata]|uniref:Zinc finger PHD-type domain-containing protein n=1 Tax=Aristolochia fimbriata TaxID=158543 RepID=A0AAV7F9C8_ARIFI|nr:hypothetical protein H6P81_002293 [Aristolochia fimbriata]
MRLLTTASLQVSPCGFSPIGSSYSIWDFSIGIEIWSPLEEIIFGANKQGIIYAGDLRGGRTSAAFQRHKEEEVYSICGVPCYAELMVLCDDCNQVSEHIYCMRNHLDEVPDIWFCEACQVRRDSDSYCPTTSSNMNENSSDKSDAAASFQEHEKMDSQGKKTEVH